MLKKITWFVILTLALQSKFIAANKAAIPQNSPSLLVISCSLNPESKSYLIAKKVYDSLKEKGHDINFLDLRDYKLPIANGHDQSAYADPQVREIHDRISRARGIIIASPIYNYGIAATTKNLFELTSHPYKQILSGAAWQNKVVGFVSASGSPRSMLAFFPFLNSLMMDAKVIIIPQFVIASREDFKENVPSEETKQKIEELVREFTRMTQVLGRETSKILS